MSSIEAVIEFFSTGKFKKLDDVWHSKTRDEFQGRLSSWPDHFLRLGANEASAVMLAAVVGELGNNAFDHNLGKWKDEVGCVLGFSDLNSVLRLAIADRGQGIVASLRHAIGREVLPDEVLRIAFEEKISGRAPERRGNGLKFVSRQFRTSFGDALLCRSGGCVYKIGSHHFEFEKNAREQQGTLIVFDWRKG